MPEASAAVALRGALWALWTADAEVVSFVGSRVFDRVPKKPTFPYVVLGESQDINETDEVSCSIHRHVFLTVHVWSRKVGRIECERIVALLRVAMEAAELTPNGWHVAELRDTDSRVFADPDGLTTHGVITIDAWLEKEGA